MGTWLSPPTMLVDYVQKLAPIFIVNFSKSSITGVTSSDAYVQKLAPIFIVVFFKSSITGVTNSGAT